jgi:glycine hydroxymethyltransferase
MSSLLDLAVFLVTKEDLMHIMPAKAVAFGEALQDEFFTYALQLQKNAKAMAAFVKREIIYFRRYRQPHDVD